MADLIQQIRARETSLPPTAIVRLKAALLSGGFLERDMPYDAIACEVAG